MNESVEPVLRPYDDSPESIRALALAKKHLRDYPSLTEWRTAVQFEEFKIALGYMASKGEPVTLATLGRKILGDASRNHVGYAAYFLKRHAEYPLDALLSAAREAATNLRMKTILFEELEGTGPSDAELILAARTVQSSRGLIQVDALNRESINRLFMRAFLKTAPFVHGASSYHSVARAVSKQVEAMGMVWPLSSISSFMIHNPWIDTWLQSRGIKRAQRRSLSGSRESARVNPADILGQIVRDEGLGLVKMGINALTVEYNAQLPEGAKPVKPFMLASFLRMNLGLAQQVLTEEEYKKVVENRPPERD